MSEKISSEGFFSTMPVPFRIFLAGVLLFAFASFVSGCAAFAETSERTAEKVGKVVRSYCVNSQPAQRAVLREIANRNADPYRVCVDCNDPEGTGGCRIVDE